MRVGLVVKVIADKKIGFIRADDLREDVFFHFSVVEAIGTRDLEEGEEVEFEIEELDRIEKRKMRATMVRRSIRPLTMRIQSSDAPELKAHHHPNARKRRPTWRDKKESSDDPSDRQEEVDNSQDHEPNED